MLNNISEIAKTNKEMFLLQLLLFCLLIPVKMSALLYTVTTDDVDGDGVLNSTEIGIGTDPEVFNSFNGYVDPNTFTYAFNLYDQWDEYLLSSYQAEVYSEVSAGNATYWRPLVPNSEGSIIYKFDFQKNISSLMFQLRFYRLVH